MKYFIYETLRHEISAESESEAWHKFSEGIIITTNDIDNSIEEVRHEDR